MCRRPHSGIRRMKLVVDNADDKIKISLQRFERWCFYVNPQLIHFVEEQKRIVDNKLSKAIALQKIEKFLNESNSKLASFSDFRLTGLRNLSDMAIGMCKSTLNDVEEIVLQLDAITSTEIGFNIETIMRLTNVALAAIRCVMRTRNEISEIKKKFRNVAVEEFWKIFKIVKIRIGIRLNMFILEYQLRFLN